MKYIESSVFRNPFKVTFKVITHNQDDAESGDYGVSYFKILRQWLRDSWTQLLLAFFVVYTICSAVYLLFTASVNPDSIAGMTGTKIKASKKGVKKVDSRSSLPVKGQGG